ncbi:MAG: hypothetical protein RLZZ304_273 [Actinomycetota bacterium]
MRPGQHRQTARVLLHERRERFLFLKTEFDPEVGLPPRWITPGGGVDLGETTLQAAIRELREETGLVVEPGLLGEPIWVSTGTWNWGDGIHHHTHEDVFYQLDITSVTADRQVAHGGQGYLGVQAASQHLDKSAPQGLQSTNLTAESFVLDKTLWTEDEHRDVLEFRWWSAQEILETNELVGPQDLPERLRAWLEH